MLVKEPGKNAKFLAKSQPVESMMFFFGIFVQKKQTVGCVKGDVYKRFFFVSHFSKTTHFLQTSQKMGGKFWGQFSVIKKNSLEAVAELLDLFETHGNSGSFGGCGYLQCSTHSYRDPGKPVRLVGWMGETDDMFFEVFFPKKTESPKIEKHGRRHQIVCLDSKNIFLC